ncbi:hypothetical protein TNCV_4343451 [Trichonephila clavipes]|nr:hypothetical protein TNCV_4343451 [Trichonephila clavipes]
MDSGITRKNQENYSLIEKENRKLMEEIEDLEGELTLIGSCPIENCQYHSKLNSSKIAQKVKESSKQLEFEFKKSATNTSALLKRQPPDGTTKPKARVGRLRGRDNSSPPKKKKKRNQKVIENDDSGTFGFMDAIIELKKFFTEYPSH